MTILLDKHPADLDGIFVQTLVAIDQAIVEANRNTPRFIAVRGQRHSTGRGDAYYTFTLLDEAWEPVANTSVRIEIDPDDPKRTLSGTALSVVNTTITLVTETPLPQAALEKVLLFEETAWLLEKHREVLESLRERGETPAHMAAKTFSLLPCYEGLGKPKARIPSFLPDKDQARAIALGMESERVFVIGPPGTGKTSVQVALALEYMQAGKRVILAAYTNKALDTAVQRLQQYCEESGHGYLIKNHRVVRIGKTTELVDEAYRDITLQGIVDQQLGSLAQERNQLQQQQSDLEDRIAHLTRDLTPRKEQWMHASETLLSRLKNARDALAPLQRQEEQRLIPIAARLAAIPQDRVTEQEKEQAAAAAAAAWADALLVKREEQRRSLQALNAKRAELASLRRRSPAERLFARLGGITEKSLTKEIEQWEVALAAAEQEVAAYERNKSVQSMYVYQAERHLAALDDEERRVSGEQQRRTSEGKMIEALLVQIAQDEQTLSQGDKTIAGMEEALAREERTLSQVKERLETIESEQRTVASRVVSEAQLIATTLTGITTSPYLRDRLFDAVIIDEASMASLAILLVAVARATRHVAIFGDPRQLAPIIKLQAEREARLAAYWLGTDLFSHLRITLEDADAGTNQVVLLSYQARMLPEIAFPVSQFVYGGRLKNRIDPSRIPLRLAPHPASPLMLVDTGDVDQGKRPGEQLECYAQRTRNGSKHNPYHVLCVVKLVRTLLAQQPDLDVERPWIGVVTPYSAQKIKIRNALRTQGLLRWVHVGTVHGYQSVEYPCIIFDVVEGHNIPISQFTSNAWGKDGIASSATRLINVAHSRARDKLIYIANVAYIREEVYRRKHLLTKFVNYADEFGHLDSRVLFEETPSGDDRLPFKEC